MQELKEVFGNDVKLIKHHQKVRSGHEVIELMKKNDCSEVMAGLPLSMVQELVDQGIQPIRAIMERKIHSEGGRVTFSHKHFERIEDIHISTVKLLKREGSK